MPKRISKKPAEDGNESAFRILQNTIDNSEAKSSDPAIDAKLLASRIMSEMGRKGGKIGGKRSLQTMTAKERKDRAKKAATARWKNK